jgi:hypothetical protein
VRQQLAGNNQQLLRVCDISHQPAAADCLPAAYAACGSCMLLLLLLLLVLDGARTALALSAPPASHKRRVSSPTTQHLTCLLISTMELVASL